MIAIEAIEINLFEKSIRFTDSWLIEINTIRSIHAYVQYGISFGFRINSRNETIVFRKH